MQPRAHGPIALAFLLALDGSGIAQASPVCDQLRSEWMAGGSIAAIGAERDALHEAYDRQRDEIDALESRMRESGCSVGSVMVFGGSNEDDCHRLNALLSDMDRNLETISMRLDGGGSRDALAAAMRTNGCAGAPPPIAGVSQFNDPSGAQIEDLAPGARSLLPAPEMGEMPSITHIQLPPPTHAGQPQRSLPPNLGPLPQAKARPMTEREKNVRSVGPTFLPDPSEDLELAPSRPDR